MQEQIDSLSQMSEEQIKEAQDRLEEANAKNATSQANAILKKNKREIKRLNEHAQAAVLENNFAAYSYAIKKLRDLYRQPYNDELIAEMYVTTRRQIWELINAETSKI